MIDAQDIIIKEVQGGGAAFQVLLEACKTADATELEQSMKEMKKYVTNRSLDK